MKEINIAKTLVLKRKEKGITQDELATYIGVSKASVSKWETALSYPDVTFLPQLAAYFNISIDELVGYAPQMTKEDIKRLYHKLSSAFAVQPFINVLSECRAVIKKYYSCFPLLLQMSIMLLNHYMLASDKEKQEEILNEIISLCSRIKSESEDVWLSKQANSLQATCLLILQRPQEVLDLLDGTMKPKTEDDLILANAYMQTGNIHKAKQVIQISTFQHVLGIVGDAPLLLFACGDDLEMFEKIVNRIINFIELFKIKQLNASCVAVFYLTTAQSYTMKNNTDKALIMLQKYADICSEGFFPIKLHGDDFFDCIDSWFSEFDLGTEAPRDEKVVKESMIESIEKNPEFAMLIDQPRYKNIIENLKVKLGVI
jgi:transcriptional regulator with XRE-family HTH domain